MVQKKPLNIGLKKIVSGLLCYAVIAYTITSMPNNISIEKGFFIGCMVYSVFELTCYTIFEDWMESTIIIDVLWGGVVFASAFQLIKFINSFEAKKYTSDTIHPASLL